MEQVRLLWDPAGFELDSLGDKQLLRITDGDTPYVSFSIRMLSIDAPEVHYPGTQDPAAHDARLKDLGDAIEAGRVAIDAGLAAHLLPRLQSGRAGTLQKRQGEAARAGFQALLDEKLKGPRGMRPLFLRAANEHFDAYGRLLAYIAPNYSKEERARLPYAERATFNLLLVEAGLAASFPIYPSLPKYIDLVLLQNAARAAVDGRLGIWADGGVLTGYEFRLCYKLWQRINTPEAEQRRIGPWIERHCVDMTTSELFPPQQYYRVKPWNRVFVWPRDLGEAIARLNLVPPAAA